MYIIELYHGMFDIGKEVCSITFNLQKHSKEILYIMFNTEKSYGLLFNDATLFHILKFMHIIKGHCEIFIMQYGFDSIYGILPESHKKINLDLNNNC